MCKTRRAVPVILLLAVAPGNLHAQEWSYTGSLQGATGDYIFSERTWTFAFTNGLGVRHGRLRASVSLPIVVQNSSAVTIVGGHLLPTGGPDHAAVGQRSPGQHVPMGRGHGGGMQGLIAAQTADMDTVMAPGNYEATPGDPWLSAGMELHRGFGLVRSVEITGSVKAPLADLDSGVGTEAWDFSAGSSIAFGVQRLLVFADITYWWYGDLPDLELEDGLTWGVSLGRPVSERVSVLLSYAASARIIPTAASYEAATVFGSYRMTETSGISAGLTIGLSEASSDVALQLGWRIGLSGVRVQ